MNRTVKFSHTDFEKFAIELLGKIKTEATTIPVFDYRRFMSLMRGVIAYARFNDNILTMLGALPVDETFKGFHDGYMKLLISAKESFKNTFLSVADCDVKEFYRYIKLENDLILAGELIRFILTQNPKYHQNPAEINVYKTIISDHVEKANFRLTRMATTYLSLTLPSKESIRNDVNNKTSRFYHSGSRYAIAGQIINDAARQ